MRSALFVPGDSERKLEKALSSGADALFIDLEDSVALENKQIAREIAAAFLDEQKDQPNCPALHVRINALDTGLTENDLAAIVPHAPTGVVLPKAEHGAHVTQLSGLIGMHENAALLNDGDIAITAIITETAAGVLNVGTYNRASSRLNAVSWGAEDLSADLGALRRRDENGRYTDVFRHARVQTLLGAVAAGVQPLDTVYPDFRDEDGFKSECREAMLDGFTGKMAIHPAQVPIINAVFTPSLEDVAKAQEIVDAFEQAGNPGVLAVNGQMLDKPHLKKALRLLERAKASPRK
ncbi:MAG: CoA ester lyase [Pseudomonadota bacterium]